MTDEDYGDIVDPKTGKDIEIDYLSPKDAGNTYGKTTIKVKPKESLLTQDAQLLKKLLTEQENLIDVYKGIYGHTYEILQKALQKYLHPSETSQNTTTQEQEEKPTKQSSTTLPEKSVDDQMAELDSILDSIQ